MTEEQIRLQMENSDLRKVIMDKNKEIVDLTLKYEAIDRMLDHKDELMKLAERKVASLTADITFLADHALRDTWSPHAWVNFTGTAQELVGELREWVDGREQKKAAEPLIKHPEQEED